MKSRSNARNMNEPSTPDQSEPPQKKRNMQSPLSLTTKYTQVAPNSFNTPPYSTRPPRAELNFTPFQNPFVLPVVISYFACLTRQSPPQTDLNLRRQTFPQPTYQSPSVPRKVYLMPDQSRNVSPSLTMRMDGNRARIPSAGSLDNIELYDVNDVNSVLSYNQLSNK
jgi:hypothetical protein